MRANALTKADQPEQWKRFVELGHRWRFMSDLQCWKQKRRQKEGLQRLQDGTSSRTTASAGPATGEEEPA